MATVVFTDNLKRHINCPPQEVDGETLHEVFSQLFAEQKQLGGYVLDEQGRLRKHIMVSIDDQLIQDRIRLSDPVKTDSQIYVLQALSGG